MLTFLLLNVEGKKGLGRVVQTWKKFEKIN